MSEDLIARLEADLTAGAFRAGEWLKQSDIEEAYGAHRFDVRSALMDLRARYLIEHVPNRGYRVIALSEREREELIETRTILETAAVRMAVQRVTDQDITTLRAIVEDFDRSMYDSDLARLRQLNALFHDSFYAVSGNLILAHRIKAMRQRGLPGSRTLGWRTIASIQRSNEDHARMVDLLAARDAAGLSEVVHDHLNRFRQFDPA